MADVADLLKRNNYDSLRNRLKSERASFDSHWRDLADFTAPRRVRFSTSDKNKGDKRNQKIIDSTAQFALRTLSSGLHAGLTSPARPWMKLTTPDPDLADHGPVKEWLHIVTTRMLTVFLQTNLYNVLPIIYGDLGGFGTAAMSITRDSKDLFRCRPYALGSFVLGTDSRGIVSTFMREYSMTVRQIVQEFVFNPLDPKVEDWSKVSLTVKNLWDRGNYEDSVDVVWAVMPNAGHVAGSPLSRQKKFASCHYEVGQSGEHKYLREAGYNSFPILAPRWDVTDDDTYGTDCPGMIALGDIRQLQSMEKKKAQAIAKKIDPPLVGPEALRQGKASMLPGDITYVDVREGMQGLKSIHDVMLDISELREDMGDVRYRIQRAYYEDLFLMLARSDDRRGAQPVTAREVEERHEEKLLALGPVLERTNDELLDPLVDRVYEMMEAEGLIPPAPEELSGVDLKVEYISIMAQAQKLVGVVGQDRLLQTVVPLMEQFPQVGDKLNIMQIVDNYADMLGVDPRTIVDTKVARAAGEQRAQAQKQMADAQQAELLSKAAKNAAGAPLDGDTALSRVIGRVSPEPQQTGTVAGQQ